MASSSSQHRDLPAGTVEVSKGVNGLDTIILHESRGGYVQVYLLGAQVMSWKNTRREEMLFVSSKATFEPPKHIRGGIPVCFPRFGGVGIGEHGFARKRIWSVDTNSPYPPETSSQSYVDLILEPTKQDVENWPHKHEFRLRIILRPGGDLILIPRVRNVSTDGKPFSFTFAFHSHFAVSDIGEIRVEGLETVDYLDNLKNEERFTDQGDALTFEEETDKIYMGAPNKIAIIDHHRKRTVVLRKSGLPDVVVWNPWEKKAKTITDLGNADFKKMLCVAPAAIENPIKLKPGEEWTGRLHLTSVPSSYYSGHLDTPQRS